MKPKFIQYGMEMAVSAAKLSHARRLKVGAVIVKDGNRPISVGYNGMPEGWDNNCEDIVWDNGAGGWLDPEEFDALYPFEAWHEGAEMMVRYGLKTKPEVLHAESNAIAKLATSTESSDGASLFCTHAPCLECAKLIHQARIVTLYYQDDYRDSAGLDFLRKSGVNVNKYPDCP